MIDISRIAYEHFPLSKVLMHRPEAELAQVTEERLGYFNFAAVPDIDRFLEEFDALVIPGGHSPDHIRTDATVVEFVRRFAESGRPLAAVCHGPQLLIEAGVVEGRTMTSWPSVKTDLVNAGARWVDEQVVTDGSFITARKPVRAVARSPASAARPARIAARSASIARPFVPSAARRSTAA